MGSLDAFIVAAKNVEGIRDEWAAAGYTAVDADFFGALDGSQDDTKHCTAALFNAALAEFDETTVGSSGGAGASLMGFYHGQGKDVVLDKVRS
jgi:hypothetical protein